MTSNFIHLTKKMSCNFPLLFHCFCTHLVPKLRKYFYFEFRLTDIFRLFEFTCQFLVFGTFDRFLIQLTSFATSHAMMKLQAKPVKTMKMLVSFDCIELKRFLNWAKLSPCGTLVKVQRSTTWISFLLIRNLFVDLNFIERQIIPNLCKWNISVTKSIGCAGRLWLVLIIWVKGTDHWLSKVGRRWFG